jgi:hypothetical protein
MNRIAEFLDSIPTEQVRPISLHPAGTFNHDPLHVTASIGQAEHRSATVVWRGHTLQIPSAFEPNQQVVHCLFRHVRPSGKLCRADPVRPRALKDVHVSGREVRMSGGLQFGIQPSTYGEMEAPDERCEQGRVH